MLVKDLLNKYSGEFYIYENVYNEHGDLINDDCIASYETFKIENKYINKIKERKVHDFVAGRFFLNIYLEDDYLKVSDNIMNENIIFLGLPTRILNALYRARIKTIGELCNKTYLDIVNVHCLGKNSIKELIETMEIYNLSFKENEK